MCRSSSTTCGRWRSRPGGDAVGEGHFLTKRLNIWTNAGVQWIPAEVWAACSLAVDEEELIGRTCYGRLDLSSTLDLSAFVLVFPPTVDDPLFRCCRASGCRRRPCGNGRRRSGCYMQWVADGHIIMVPGDVLDYEYIYERIDADRERFNVENRVLIAGVRHRCTCAWLALAR